MQRYVGSEEGCTVRHVCVVQRAPACLHLQAPTVESTGRQPPTSPRTAALPAVPCARPVSQAERGSPPPSAAPAGTEKVRTVSDDVRQDTPIQIPTEQTVCASLSVLMMPQFCGPCGCSERWVVL